MPIDLEYENDNGDTYAVRRNIAGFWISEAAPEPKLYSTTFNLSDNINGVVTLKIDGNAGDWLQIDNARLFGAGIVDDSYKLSVHDFNTETISGDPQGYQEIAEFPNDVSSLMVPVNEFMTYSAFNTILYKMYENYEYLVAKGQYINVPPNALSFRYGHSTYPEYSSFGEVWQQLDSGNYAFWDYDEVMNVDNVVASLTFMVHSIGNTIIGSYVTSGSNPDEYEREHYIYGNDTFNNIIALDIDSSQLVWVLDENPDNTSKIGVFRFNEGWKYINTLEGKSISDPAYIKNPTDLKINNGNVYITGLDSDNKGVIKKFTESGSYLGEIVLGEIAIESIAITNNYIIGLYENRFYIYDHSFNKINIVDLDEKITEFYFTDQSHIPSTITKLSNNIDDFFFYGIAHNMVYKFNESGGIIESFGETAVNYLNTSSVSVARSSKPISDIYHDANYNLYVASEFDIIKYLDRIELGSRILDDLSFNIDSSQWTVDDINVTSDEHTTAWVYNRVFDRIYDNLATYRLALQGSLVLVSTSTFEQVNIDNFTPSNYTSLPYAKGDINIGINELHCEGSINRCILKLHECFDVCRELLNIRETVVDPNSLILNSLVLVDYDAQKIGDTYYYETGTLITSFDFIWSDNIPYRDDSKLSATLTFDSIHKTFLSKYPTPTTYTDIRTLNSGDHSWELEESYGGVTKSKTVNIKWGSSIFAGTLPDVPEHPLPADIITQPNLQISFINSPLYTTLLIDIRQSDQRRFYIAVPADDYDAGHISLRHDLYPHQTEYIFSGDNKYELIMTNNVRYYIFIGPNGQNPVYVPGIDQLAFTIVRGN